MSAPFVSRTFAVLAISTSLAFSLSYGQQQGGQQQAPPPGQGAPGGTPGTPGAPGGTPGSIPGRGERVPPIGEPRERQQTFPEMQRPIFISGKVMLDDGTAPTDQVVIEKVCNGQPMPQGYTDSKGRFQFQLGNNMAMLPDASIGSAADSSPMDMAMGRGNMGGQRGGFGGMQRGVNERDLIGCELRASLAGYRSDIINLTGRRVMDNPDVGTIVLRRLAQVEGLTISATTALAPKDARKAYEKGRESGKKNKLEDAEKHFAKAVELYPKHAAAWFELGRLQEHKKDIAEARKSYAEALAADAKFVSPYLQLAGLAANENNWQEVRDTTDRIIRLNPVDFPRAFLLNAVANLQLKNLDAAEKSAREAVKLDERHQMPKIEHVLGVIMAQKNDFNAAAEHMRNYLKFAPKASDAEHVKGQLAELDRLRGGSAVSQKQPE